MSRLETESHNKQLTNPLFSGPYDPVLLGVPSPVIVPSVTSSDTSFTYLVTPRLQLTPDLMVYARWRLDIGRVGRIPTMLLGAPASFKPDTTRIMRWSKAMASITGLSFDASLYYIIEGYSNQYYDP